MFVSIGYSLSRTESGFHLELTNNDGYKGVLELVPDFIPELNGSYSGSIVMMPKPQRVDRNKPKRRQQISRKQEEGLAQSHDGRRHNGSGNRLGYAGDVRADGRYRIEAKYTTALGYRVNRSDLNKIRSECGLGEVPVFAIDFKEPNTLRTEDSWVLVPRSAWEKHVQTSNDQ